jgi:hypothetical protein
MVTVVIATILAPPAHGRSGAEALEARMAGVRREIMQKRDSALEVLLTMNAEQAAAFWPIQKSYDRELERPGKAEQELGREFSDNYDKLTAESAARIAERFFNLERERLSLQQNYFQQISEAVSPVIAVQLIQLQRQFETELELARMKAAPLAR